MQELMFLHSLSRPANDTLFNQFQFEISGDFDFLAFRNAWQTVIDRYPALRTGFIWQDIKLPLQVIRTTEIARLDLPEEMAGQ